MNEDQENPLECYLKNSEVRVVTDTFRVRLSKELAIKYDQGAYDVALSFYASYIEEINQQGICYPGRANPIFYLYLVPNETCSQLLQFSDPSRTTGGKPVPCFDLDGFSSAYAESENFCLSQNQPSLSQKINLIHEFAHLVHGQFFHKNCFMSEGFAEAFPLYTMGYERSLLDHRQLLKNIDSNLLYSAKELLELERAKTFYKGEGLHPHHQSCSFQRAYLSSYLFVRGCLTQIERQHHVSRQQATQMFLELLRHSSFTSEYLILDLAHRLNYPSDQLLNGLTLQRQVIEEL